MGADHCMNLFRNISYDSASYMALACEVVKKFLQVT